MEDFTNREKIMVALMTGMFLGGFVVASTGVPGIDMQGNPIFNLEHPEEDDPSLTQAATVQWVQENAAGGVSEFEVPVGGPEGTDGEEDPVEIPTESPT